MDPQPGPGDPIWGGRDPETSQVRRCHLTGRSGPDGLPWIDYVVTDGEPDAGPAVDPAVLAQTALERLPLEPVQVGMAPETSAADPDSMGLVGLPVWLWVADPSELTYFPADLTVSAGAVSVSLTAQVERVEWSMGDGTRVTYTGTGTAPAGRCRPSPPAVVQRVQAYADDLGVALQPQTEALIAEVSGTGHGAATDAAARHRRSRARAIGF